MNTCNTHPQSSQQGFYKTVAPNEEASFEYVFIAPGQLEPRDWTVALSAFYVDSKGTWYSSTFFNQTIEYVEVKKLIDYELYFLVLLGLGIVGGIGECLAQAILHQI